MSRGHVESAISGSTLCRCILYVKVAADLRATRCIYQDDLDDSTTEVSRMKVVYTNAACTIAATAAGSSDEGLFFERDPWLLRSCRLTATWNPETYISDDFKLPPAGEYWCDYHNLWMYCIEYAPLNKRGWVSRERHLPRRIMHFTSNQLFWECHECRASENYSTGLPAWLRSTLSDADPTQLKYKMHKLHQRMTFLRAKAPLEAQERVLNEELEDLYMSWVQWREGYSRSAVTKDTDKLIAIQGIAQDVS